MGFKDELKEQSKDIARNYSKKKFPYKGNVDENVINTAIENIISYLQRKFTSEVSGGRKNVKNSMMSFSYCYFVTMKLGITMGYLTTGEGIPFEIEVGSYGDIIIKCSNFEQIRTFIYALNSKLNEEFSKTTYVTMKCEFEIIHISLFSLISSIKNKLRRAWISKVIKWKTDNKVKFDVSIDRVDINVEIKCNRKGIVK